MILHYTMCMQTKKANNTPIENLRHSTLEQDRLWNIDTLHEYNNTISAQ